MDDYSVILPPDVPVPEPQEPPWLRYLFAAAMTVLFGGLAVFVCVEWLLDLSGHPLSFAPVPPPQSAANAPPDSTGELKYFKLLTPKPSHHYTGKEISVLAAWRPPNPNERMPLQFFELWIDDYLIAWDMQFGTDTWLAKVPLEAGKHHLRTLAFECDFYVDQEVPKRTSHCFTDDAAGCKNCHIIEARKNDVQTKRRSLSVGQWKGADSCYLCHKQEECPQKNSACLECHTIH